MSRTIKDAPRVVRATSFCLKTSVAALLSLSVSHTWAQTSPTTTPAAPTDNAPEIVVSASGSEQVVTDTLPHTTIIDRQTIENTPLPDVVTLLRTQAGVSARQSGAQGSLSGVSIRGGEPRHTLIMIDGVPMSSASSGTAALEQIPLSTIEKIEIVRGNVSALYGSQAVGGVVNIFTRRAKHENNISLRVAGGNRDQQQASAQVNLSGEHFSFTAGISKDTARTVSTQDPVSMKRIYKTGEANPDLDKYSNTTGNFHLRYNPNERHEFGLRVMESQGKNEYDSSFNTADSIQSNRTKVSNVTLYSDNRFTDNWRSIIKVSQFVDQSYDFDWPPAYGSGVSYFKTRTNQISWQNNIHTDNGDFNVGGAHNEQKLYSDTQYDQSKRTINSGWVGYNLDRKRHHLQVNMRLDNITGMDSEANGAINYGFDITPKWRIQAGYSSGFSLPNFNELYYPYYSNPNLRAEHANYTELGLQYNGEGYGARLTAFNTVYRDKIATDPDTYLPVNLDRARGRGLEYHGWMNLYGFDVNLGLTYQSIKNSQTGERLIRHPRWLANLGVGKTFGKWQVQADWVVQSHMGDIKNTKVAGFGTVNAAVYYRPIESVKIGLSVNNMFNRHYQPLYGYNGSPRTVLLSLQYQPSFK